MTTILYLQTSPLNDDERYSRLFDSLSDYRKQKTSRRRQREDRNLSLGAGILLDRALAPYGLHEKDMTYAEGPHGKPYFADLPSLHFSLSHTEGVVMAAFSEEGELGCDIEQVREADLAVARRFFTAEEYQTILREDDENARRKLFFRLWTLKESYLKETGLGFSLPLNAFSVSLRGNGPAIVSSSDGKNHDLRELSPVPGCCAAVCTAYEITSLSAEEVTV